MVLASLVVAVASAMAGACGSERPPPGVDGTRADTAVPVVSGDLGAGGAAPCTYGPQTGADGFCAGGTPDDEDGDGFTVADGDCNDADCSVNPGAFDVPGNQIDEDCSGVADDEPRSCDAFVGLDGADPMGAAAALGLCRQTTAQATGRQRTWGVLSARWLKPDSSAEVDPISRGVLASFGTIAPKEGSRMLVLSSGTARAPGMAGWQSPAGHSKGYGSGTPSGYPKPAPACPGVETGPAFDGAALELTVRAPTNARGLSFEESFFTFEFPDFICSPFNDYFVTMMWPTPPGLPDANIAFDEKGNPVSVNNVLLGVCAPQVAGGKRFACPLGGGALRGTGFEDHAATGWITTRAPVRRGGVFTLLFAIWDSGDGVLDSTVLVDHFEWSTEPVKCTQTTPSPQR